MGAVAYLRKPLDEQDLQRALQRALGQKTSEG
jgi:FixJ family two-component response regulator